MDDKVQCAAVQFLDGKAKIKKVVPVSLIRMNSKGESFLPTCVQDVPSDPLQVKWQKSDLESDGYFPAKVICLAGE